MTTNGANFGQEHLIEFDLDARRAFDMTDGGVEIFKFGNFEEGAMQARRAALIAGIMDADQTISLREFEDRQYEMVGDCRLNPSTARVATLFLEVEQDPQNRRHVDVTAKFPLAIAVRIPSSVETPPQKSPVIAEAKEVIPENRSAHLRAGDNLYGFRLDHQSPHQAADAKLCVWMIAALRQRKKEGIDYTSVPDLGDAIVEYFPEKERARRPVSWRGERLFSRMRRLQKSVLQYLEFEDNTRLTRIIDTNSQGWLGFAPDPGEVTVKLSHEPISQSMLRVDDSCKGMEYDFEKDGEVVSKDPALDEEVVAEALPLMSDVINNSVNLGQADAIRVLDVIMAASRRALARTESGLKLSKPQVEKLHTACRAALGPSAYSHAQASRTMSMKRAVYSARPNHSIARSTNGWVGKIA